MSDIRTESATKLAFVAIKQIVASVQKPEDVNPAQDAIECVQELLRRVRTRQSEAF